MVVSTSHSLLQWNQHGINGLHEVSANLDWGTGGQGDTHSPFTWRAVIDVLLCMLENMPTSKHHFFLRKADGYAYTARDIWNVDDLHDLLRKASSWGDLRAGESFDG